MSRVGAIPNGDVTEGLRFGPIRKLRPADKLLFDTLPDAGTSHVVRDFSAAQGEKIRLSMADFAGLGAVGTLSLAAFLSSEIAMAARDADDRIADYTTTGQLFYDADGIGGQAAVQIATFSTTGHSGLAYADFLVVA